MTASLPLGAYIARVGVPLASVFASLALLTAASLALVFRIGGDSTRQGLFAAGVLAWILGIGWGVIINARPVLGRPPDPL